MFQARTYFREMRSELLSLWEKASGPGGSGDSARFSDLVMEQLLVPLLPGYYEAGSGSVFYHSSMDATDDYTYGPVSVGRGLYSGGHLPSSGAVDLDFPIVIRDRLHYPRFHHQGKDHFIVRSVRLLADGAGSWDPAKSGDFGRRLAPLRKYIYADLFSSDLPEDFIAPELDEEEESHWSGEMTAMPAIRSALLFADSASTFTLESLDFDRIMEGHYEWPDLVLLLREGKLLVKDYIKRILDGYTTGVQCNLKLYEVGPDVLLLFADLLLNHFLPESGGLELSAELGLLREYPVEARSADVALS